MTSKTESEDACPLNSEMYVLRIDESVPKELDDYYMFRNFLTDEEIERIHKEVKDLSTIDGTISQTADKSHVQTSYRSSKIKWIPKTSQFEWLYNHILRHAHTANQRMWNFQIIGMNESIQYGEYGSEYGGKYDGHLDIGNGAASRRKISLVVQLTDENEYEGGDLLFNTGQLPKRVPRQKGTAVFFPSYFHHQVTPVTKGTRHSLVVWITGDAWR